MDYKVYTPYDKPTGEIVDCSNDVNHTKQYFADETDINLIMKRYEQTGAIDPLLINQREAIFGDFSGEWEFSILQNKVVAAREAFMTLPANVRSRFHNNPAELIEFFADPANTEEAIKLGLANAPRETTPETPEPTATETGVSPHS